MLKIDDKVSLRGHSNQPNLKSNIMLVKDISYTTSKVLCIWYNSSGILEKGLFNAHSLIQIHKLPK